MWRLGVVFMLLALVFIPLSVLGVRTATDLADSDRERSTVREIVPVTEDRIRAITLGAALSDERTWSIALLGVEQFGVDPQLVEQVVGIDIAAEYERSLGVTDELSSGLPEIERRLAALRTDRSSNERIARGYAEAARAVAAIGDGASARLELLVLGRPDADQLLRQLAVTQAAARVQATVDDQFASFIGSQFVQSTSDPTDYVQDLVEERRSYGQAVAELERLVGSGPVSERLRSIRRSETERSFLRQVDARVESALRFGVSSGARDAVTTPRAEEGDYEVLFEVAVGSLDRIADFLDAARTSSAAWLGATQLAGQDLVATATELERETNEAISSSRTMLIVTGAATLLATLLVAGLVSRSVRHLARGAQRLRDGDTRPFRPSGPREVYVAGVALSEAGTNFYLLQRQADALAQGRLDDEVLERAAPGQLGSTLKQVVDRLSDSIHERELAQSDVVWQASHDRMTGLRNRSAAIELVCEALALPRSGQIAAMIVDLDGFKSINDRHGHPAGDEVLIEVASRLVQSCRPGDQVCRMGGDEFVLLLPDPADDDSASEMAGRIRDVLSRPFVLANGVRVGVRASIGIAVSECGSTVDGLLKEADLAVYEAKRSGAGRIVVCTPALLDANRRSGQIAVDILEAVENDELRVEYQPVVDASGAAIGLEALARWTHPEFGPIPPDEFITVAERNGSIVEVDRWVIRTVVRQLAAWAAEDSDLAEIPVAVNMSTRHLGTEAAVDDVLGPLRDAGIHTGLLSIEITETALIDDMADVRRNLAMLRDAGVRIAIDDFGTGYSAISQLRALPVDVVKIDRSFVSRVTAEERSDAALVQLIIDIAHLLGAQIVAEGVETEEQAAIVVGMGADAQQGWLYSRSLPPEQVPGVVRKLRGLRHGDGTRRLTAGSR